MNTDHRLRATLNRRRFVTSSGFALAGAAALAVTGCGDDDDDGASRSAEPGKPTAAPKAGGSVKVSQGRVFANWDYPLVVTDTVHQVATTSTQTLLRFKTGKGVAPTTSEVEGLLAKKWENPDDTTQILTLAQGAKWQNIAPVNGRAVTAEDIAVFFQRVLNKSNNSGLWGLIGPFISSVTAIDEQRVQFKTTTPFASLPYALASVFLAVAPKEGSTGAYDMKSTLIGSGPFLLKTSQKDSSYAFERVPEYWETGKPYIDSVEQLIITDPSLALNALMTDDLDLGLVPQPSLGSYKAANAGTVTSFPTTGRRMIFLVPRPSNAPFDDIRVRQAVRMVVDQDEIITKIFDGSGAFSGVVGPASPDWAISEQENRTLWKKDIQRAKQLLSDAGHPNGFDTKINFTPAHGAFMADLCQVVAAQLRQIGINATIVPRESAPHHEILFKFEHQGIVINAQSANVGADPHDWLYKGFSVNGIYNFAQPPDRADSQLQALIDQQARTFDPAARKKVSQDAERRINELAIGIPVGNQQDNWVHNKKLQAFYPHGSGQLARYFKDVWKS